MKLLIIRLKPNPVGKDRPPQGGPTPTQLAAEWVDFRNDTGQSVKLNGVALYHLAYALNGQTSWQRITGFTGDLPAGEIVRVHSGRVRDLAVISADDRAGAHYHVFTGDDAYVWNNRQGDAPLLQNETQKQTVDKTWYAANPPEGVVLVRQGDQLAPVARAANW
jgi:hypothetical protein